MTITPNISSHMTDLSPDVVNFDVQRLGNIKRMSSPKAQLQKVSKEFEAIFITKMLNTMDKTVDRENGIFGNDDKYMQKFKSYIYDEIGRDIAHNPKTGVGFAKQIYSQMEKYLPPEPVEIQESEAIQKESGRISAPNPKKPEPKHFANINYQKQENLSNQGHIATVFDEEL